MKLVTADQMRRIDQLSAEAGVGTDVLMENAGLAVAQESWMALGTLEERRIVVLAGPGNNGGDGLVAARYLHEWGAAVQVYLLKARGEDDANYRRLLEAGVSLASAEDDAGLAKLDAALAEADLVVDALLGTGAARPIAGRLAEVLSRLAAARARPRPPILVAVDVPTGLNSDTGAVDPLTVAADHTVTLGYSKVGLHAYPGARYAGRLQVVDIGIPPALTSDLPYELMTASGVRALLPARPRDANKGTFGRVLVVAGSENYVGAAHLAAAGAYRVGAGLVTLACPRSLHPVIASGLTEATYLPLPEEEGGLARRAADLVLRAIEGYDVLLVGCGLGQRGATQSFVRALLFSLAARAVTARRRRRRRRPQRPGEDAGLVAGAEGAGHRHAPPGRDVAPFGPAHRRDPGRPPGLRRRLRARVGEDGGPQGRPHGRGRSRRSRLPQPLRQPRPGQRRHRRRAGRRRGRLPGPGPFALRGRRLWRLRARGGGRGRPAGDGRCRPRGRRPAPPPAACHQGPKIGRTLGCHLYRRAGHL